MSSHRYLRRTSFHRSMRFQRLIRYGVWACGAASPPGSKALPTNSGHHSVLFPPSNHFRRSATPMLYAFPSLAAGSSLAYKALRICLSFVPMRMAASLTVTAMRSRFRRHGAPILALRANPIQNANTVALACGWDRTMESRCDVDHNARAGTSSTVSKRIEQ